jgi:hypothetical protein
MIPGGIADKLGNRYEAKWLVRNFFHVIADKADWLKFEGVESEYKGFEFALKKGEITEWHQTKISSPNGNWTINALKKEGVLKISNKQGGFKIKGITIIHKIRNTLLLRVYAALSGL